MDLIGEMSNSWVSELLREKTIIHFLLWSTLIFRPSILEKDTTKPPMSVDQ